MFFRFLVVGGAATVVHYVVFMLLVHFSVAGIVFASSLGFAVSALLNYFLNRRFTFSSVVPHRLALPKFTIVALSGLFINGSLLYMVNSWFGVNYLIAQGVATILTIGWSYTLNRCWAFSASHQLPIFRRKELR